MKKKRISGAVGLQSPLLKLVSAEEQYGAHVIQKMIGELPPLSRALDIGAGAGRDLDLIRKHSPEVQLHGIEFDTKQCEILKSKEINTYQVDLEFASLPFEDGSFDIVIINQVLEHIKDIFFVLHEASRVLKKNGHILIGVPNVASFHNRLLLMAGRHPTQAKSYSAHIRTFSKGDTKSMIEVASNGSLRVVDFAGSQFYPFPKSIARILSSYFPSLSFSIFFLAQKNKDYVDAFYQYGKSLTASTFCRHQI
jgi:methionine biosynthesis protein MetW